METINGYEINRFSFDNYHKVSDLIYFEGPILSHYMDSSGDNYLFIWSDSDHEINRWLFCKIPLIKIHEYLQKKFSLKQILETLIDPVIKLIDIDNKLEIVKTYLIEYEKLPNSYKPKEASYYNFKPQFSEESDEYYLSIGESGILQAIFNGSKKIGYGTIPLEIFSPVVHHLNEINNGLSNSYYQNKNRERPTISGNKKAPRIKKEELLTQTSFKLAGTGPGSFKLYLVPQESQKSITEQPTETDNYFSFFFDFFNSGFEYEMLKEMVQVVSSDVLSHFEKLLKTLQINKVDFNLKWNNPSSKSKQNIKLAYKEAYKGIDNINKLEFENANDLRLIGRFVEINLITKHFTFIQDSGDNVVEARGFFAKQVADSIIQIQFSKVYEVVIARTESKEVGNKKPKIKDIMTSYVELQ